MARLRRKAIVARDRNHLSFVDSDLNDVDGEECFENHEIPDDGGDSRRKKRRIIGSNESGDNVNTLKFHTCLVCDEEDSRVLVCCEFGCPVAIHGGCLSCEPNFDEFGNFCCPYCWYKRVVIESLKLKEKVRITENAVKVGKAMREVSRVVKVEKCNGGPEKKNVVEVNCSVGKSMRLNPCENGREDDELGNERVVADTRGKRISNDRKVLRIQDSEAVEGRKYRTRGSDRKQRYREKNGDGIDTAEDEGSRQGACLGNDDDELTNGQDNSLRKDEQMEPNVSPSISSPMSTNSVDEFDTTAEEGALVVRPERAIVSSSKPSLLPKENISCDDTAIVASKTPRQSKNFIYHDGKRKRLYWTPEEEDMLRVGVEKFSILANKNMPWRKILEFGRHVFHEERTPTDLKDKWKNMHKPS